MYIAQDVQENRRVEGNHRGNSLRIFLLLNAGSSFASTGCVGCAPYCPPRLSMILLCPFGLILVLVLQPRDFPTKYGRSVCPARDEVGADAVSVEI